jgi:hypothetical protein
MATAMYRDPGGRAWTPDNWLWAGVDALWHACRASADGLDADEIARVLAARGYDQGDRMRVLHRAKRSWAVFAVRRVYPTGCGPADHWRYVALERGKLARAAR